MVKGTFFSGTSLPRQCFGQVKVQVHLTLDNVVSSIHGRCRLRSVHQTRIVKSSAHFGLSAGNRGVAHCQESVQGRDAQLARTDASSRYPRVGVSLSTLCLLHLTGNDVLACIVLSSTPHGS